MSPRMRHPQLQSPHGILLAHAADGGAVKVTVKTILPHPPERVFDFIADMRNDTQWAPMVRDVQQIAGDGPGAGARYRYVQQMGRHEVPMEAEITHFDRPHRLQWRIDHKSMDYVATMHFAPHRNGTRIVQTNVETWHFAPWFLKLTGPLLVKKQLRRQLALLGRALSKERGKEED